jgi:hypothetical protein
MGWASTEYNSVGSIMTLSYLKSLKNLSSLRLLGNGHVPVSYTIGMHTLKALNDIMSDRDST